MKRIFSDVWGVDLEIVEREFTLVGVNPALDEFKDLALVMKEAAERDAIVAGQSLAVRVSQGAAA